MTVDRVLLSTLAVTVQLDSLAHVCGFGFYFGFLFFFCEDLTLMFLVLLFLRPLVFFSFAVLLIAVITFTCISLAPVRLLPLLKQF